MGLAQAHTNNYYHDRHAVQVCYLPNIFVFQGGHIYNIGAPAALTIGQPWFHRQLSRKEAEKRLEEMDEDSFIVRESTTQFGRLILVLSVKNGRKFYHFFIDRGVGTYEVEGTNLPFSSPVELIDYYKKYGLPEGVTGKVILINTPCNFTITHIDDGGASLALVTSNNSFIREQL